MDLDLRILSFKDLTFESRKSLEGFANPNPNLFKSAALSTIFCFCALGEILEHKKTRVGITLTSEI